MNIDNSSGILGRPAVFGLALGANSVPTSQGTAVYDCMTYYTTLHYTILHYDILYCTILYYTILYYNVLIITCYDML